MALAKECQIGTSQAGLVHLADIPTGIPEAIPQPRMRYYPERSRVRLTSRKQLAVGAPYIIWHWDFIKSEWRHALRDYLTGVTTEFFIESLSNTEDGSTGTDVWVQYQVYAFWPEGDENKDTGRRLGFDIEFEVIQELTPL